MSRGSRRKEMLDYVSIFAGLLAQTRQAIYFQPGSPLAYGLAWWKTSGRATNYQRFTENMCCCDERETQRKESPRVCS